jgi:hypothetical protein
MNIGPQRTLTIPQYMYLNWLVRGNRNKKRDLQMLEHKLGGKGTQNAAQSMTACSVANQSLRHCTVPTPFAVTPPHRMVPSSG